MNYESIIANDESNLDAEIFYTDPKLKSAEMQDRIAFWNTIEVVPYKLVRFALGGDRARCLSISLTTHQNFKC